MHSVSVLAGSPGILRASVPTPGTSVVIISSPAKEVAGKWQLQQQKVACKAGQGGGNWERVLKDTGFLFGVMKTF